MSITIGALVSAQEITPESLAGLKDMGFEGISISFWEQIGKTDLASLAEIATNAQLPVTALSIWGNPLANDLTLASWKTLIQSASLFGKPFVTGFAGRIPNGSVEESLVRWKQVFSMLLEDAYHFDCRGLLMENCRIGDVWKRGKWNIAINDAAWELLFATLDDEKLGLEWEPCHQVESMVDPLPQLERWRQRIHHVHGKDAHIDWDLLHTIGLYSPQKAISPTLPGKGDTDWKALIQILSGSGFSGSIDIETEEPSFFANPTQKAEALAYLKACRL